MSDLIDRHDVTDSIVELWAKKPFGNPALSEICECIKRVPSAQPERKKGKWMWEYKEATTRHCSNCDFIVLEEEANNFCPNCGADMRE